MSDTQTCGRCRATKPVRDFIAKGVQRKRCVDCREAGMAYARRHRIDAPDAYRASYAKQNSRPGVKDRQRAWANTHKELMRAAARAWRASNPAKAKAATTRWIVENRERSRAIHTKAWHYRRARRAGVEGSFTAAEFKALCEAFGNVCLACGCADVKLTVDHVIPISRGGVNTIDNIQPLCIQCNSRKSDGEDDYRSNL